jgi:DNA (cytosine-5)-methyltransferase 1
MTFGSLFAGIGGFDLGFERAGLTCSWQVEIDPFCQRVLAKHWPGVRRHDDVKTFPPTSAEGWRVDVICGGFPCQDISNAGKKAGIDGERSGLWAEFARIIRVVRPRFVVVENVAALLGRGMGRVLGDLAASGYDAEWGIIPASAMGAPHYRERLFLLAYPASRRCERFEILGRAAAESFCQTDHSRIRESSMWRAWALRVGSRGGIRLLPDGEPSGTNDGLPVWMDRLAAIGNAIIPKIAEWIGKQIMETA